MKMSNILYNLLMILVIVLLTIVMLPITFAIMIIEWMCGLFVSSDDDE